MAALTMNKSGSGAINLRDLREQAAAPKLARAVVFILSALLAGALLLAWATDVQELVRGDGKITPTGQLLQVENIEAGVVKRVLVQEGAQVRAGALLAELSSPQLDRERAALGREFELLASRISMAEFMLAQSTLPAPRQERDVSGFGQARRALHVARQTMLEKRALDLAATTDVLQQALSITKDRLAAQADNVKRVALLLERGHVSQQRLSDEADRLDQLRTSLIAAKVALANAIQAHSEAKAAAQDNDLSFREQNLEQLFELKQEQSILDQRQEALNDRQTDLQIRAVADGVIQSATYPNPGELLNPGTTLFELLPGSARLIAEVQIATDDIGHVKTGDGVALKFKTYDVRRYGQLDGQIISLSPTLVVDSNGAQFFRARVELQRTTIGQGKWEMPVRAGMIVTAEIITAKRSVLTYLLKPVQRSLDMAFSER